MAGSSNFNNTTNFINVREFIDHLSHSKLLCRSPFPTVNCNTRIPLKIETNYFHVLGSFPLTTLAKVSINTFVLLMFQNRVSCHSFSKFCL